MKLPLDLQQDGEFQACGPEEDPTAKLLVRVRVNGVPHHLEARAVTWDASDTQRGVTEELEAEIAELYEAVGGDGGWKTVELNEREYVLIMTPYCY